MPNNNNPWLGLKTYSEGQILYGRSEEINALSQDILFNRQTVVYGKSGIGKSSLLNAGVFPILRRSNMFPVNVRLDHKSKKINYCEQIQRCVEESLHSLRRDVVGKDGKKQILENLKGQKKELCAVVPNDEGESLWEYFHRHVFYNDLGEEIQPVIVFDQFEEIFTICKEEETRRQFFDQLADLINDVPPSYIYKETDKSEDELDTVDDGVIDGNEDFVLIEDDEEEESQAYNYLQEPKFHVVITLREDFLSYLERYTTNIPLLKHNRYCLRPLSDDQAGIIITDPVPGLISDDVAVEIICKITDSNSNEFKLGDGVAQLEVDSAILSLFLSELYKKKAPEDTTISKELVQAIGDNIISSFYEETIARISEKSAEYLERRLVTDDERRDSIFEDRALLRGVTKEELKYLKDERLIHEFPWNDDGMRIEFMHDILCPVIVERRKKREQKRLQEEEERKREEEAQKRIEEEERKRKEVERKAEEDKRKLIEEAKKIRKRNRRRLSAIAIFAALIGLFTVVWCYLFVWDYSEDYGNFTTLNGWPVGLGDELKNKDDKERLIVHYRLTRKGRLSRGSSPFCMVEILDANDKPCTNKFYETPIVGLLEKEMDDEKAAAFAALQQKTSYWIYSSGDTEYKEVARCTAYGLDKKELYSIQYYKDKTFASADESKYVQWAVFNDVNGKQMMVTDNGADRMRQTVKNGLVTGCLFFTELGTPQKDAYNAYGYQYEVDSISRQIQKRYYVDKFGAKIDSTLIEYYNFEYGRVQKTSLFEVKYPQQGMIVYQFKNFNDTLLFNKNGTLGYGRFHTMGGEYSEVVFKYDEKDNPLLNMKYSNGLLVESKSYEYQSGKVSKIDILEDGMAYTELYSYPDSSTKEVAFWKGNNKFSKKCTNEFKVDTLYYHKRRTTTTKDSLYVVETTEYLDTLGNPISSNDGHYAKYSIHRDATKNIRLEYFYNGKGEICKSEWFDYDDYGNMVSRAVAGVEGKPVRCPKWDRDGLCYYKMAVLYPFNCMDKSKFVSAKGVDELGETSLITKEEEGILYNLCVNEIEYHYIVNVADINKIGVAIAQTDKEKCNLNYSAVYTHILDSCGTFYKYASSHDSRSGIRDGDIILEMLGIPIFPNNNVQKIDMLLNQIQKKGGQIKIARANPLTNSYDTINYMVPAGVANVETHRMGLTKQEYNKLLKSF